MSHYAMGRHACIDLPYYVICRTNWLCGYLILKLVRSARLQDILIHPGFNETGLILQKERDKKANPHTFLICGKQGCVEWHTLLQERSGYHPLLRLEHSDLDLVFPLPVNWNQPLAEQY